MGLIFHTKSSLKKLKNFKADPFDPVIAAIAAQNINSCTTEYINSKGQKINLQQLKCETFKREDLDALLEDPNVTHIRIYMGVQEKGTITERKPEEGENSELAKTHYCLIIVPIVHNHEVIEKDENVREYGYPCPPICDPKDLENDQIAPRKLNPR